jgi:hypothetical protein
MNAPQVQVEKGQEHQDEILLTKGVISRSGEPSAVVTMNIF